MFNKIDINTLLLNRMSSKPVNTKETFGLFYTLKYKYFFGGGIFNF